MTLATLEARKRWRIRQPQTPSDPQLDLLTRETRLHPLVAALLPARGIRTPEDADRFLNPRLTHLHDPDLLPGVTPASQRLTAAIRDKRPIIIYGDYDVDGVTASAILWHMLTTLGANVSTYIPHRLEEGYGLNADALLHLTKTAQKNHAKSGGGGKPLIISVDCGITAVEPARAAIEAGAELIITDHHGFDPKNLPPAHELVHPGLPSDTPYPWPELCGAGVALKLAWATARQHTGSDKLSPDLRALMLDLVSLAALGTVADVVPLLDENRVIASIGLNQIKRTRFIGLTAMIRAAKLESEKVSAHHVGFVLGPRLNACGRMGHAGEALKLLTDPTPEQADDIALKLTEVNNQRRTTERTIVDQAKQQVTDAGWDSPDHRALVLLGDDWHPGVLGIVASRLVEAFGRPAIVLTQDADGTATGSARSVDGVSILDGLHTCADCFTRFGGHDMAAGMTLPAANVNDLRNRLVAWVNTQLTPEQLRPTLDLEAPLPLADCNHQLCDQLDRLGPFGRANPAPRWSFDNLVIDDHPRQMGKTGNHLALRLADPNSRQRIRAVGWSMGDLADQLAPGVRIDLAGVPKRSEWQGITRIEIEISDLRINTTQP
ncbi:MAG: single-stranded-DNA-specific exonuclease RecJ [Phycisphaeraceae bacterium]